MPLLPSKDTKPALKSRTIVVGLGVLVPSLIALILHYFGANDLDGKALGAAWTAAVTAVATIGLRFLDE